jgi:hypothetical protein
MTIALSMVVLAQGVLGSGAAPFPVPRAQEEFAKLGPHVRGYCGAIEGDNELFRRAVLPFAPMDLTVAKGTGPECEVLRNLYLGFVGAFCKVDAAAMAQSFHCGSMCTASRRDGLVRNLRQLKELVRDFVAMNGIDLVSQWGVVGEFRVDNVFVMMGQANETKPSPVMGFIPSDAWEHLSGPDDYLKRKHVSPTAFQSLLGKVKALSLAAVVREKQAVRVVRVGISDNESGLLFLNWGVAEPRVGELVSGGRRYSIVEPLEKGIVFYETD